MTQPRLRIALWTAIVFTLPATGFAATDWKTYPGTLCQPGHRSENIDYDAFGGICNLSPTENVVIHCPVVRDLGQSRFPIFIRHSGRSGNTAIPLVCRLRTMRLNAVNSGSAMEFEVVDLETIPENPSSTTIRTRETDLTRVSLEAEDWGAHVISCDLPPFDFVQDRQAVWSCLYNYSIREWDGR